MRLLAPELKRPRGASQRKSSVQRAQWVLLSRWQAECLPTSTAPVTCSARQSSVSACGGALGTFTRTVSRAGLGRQKSQLLEFYIQHAPKAINTTQKESVLKSIPLASNNWETLHFSDASTLIILNHFNFLKIRRCNKYWWRREEKKDGKFTCNPLLKVNYKNFG